MRAKFVGKDDVYHGVQSREGRSGTVITTQMPYVPRITKYVYFAPDTWGGSCAITDRKDLVGL